MPPKGWTGGRAPTGSATYDSLDEVPAETPQPSRRPRRTKAEMRATRDESDNSDASDGPGFSINWKRVGIVLGIFVVYQVVAKMSRFGRDLEGAARDSTDAEVARDPLASLGTQVGRLSRQVENDVLRIETDALDLEQRVTSLEKSLKASKEPKGPNAPRGGPDATT